MSLGEPIEPARTEDVVPWWRVVDRITQAAAPVEPAAATMPEAMAWPID